MNFLRAVLFEEEPEEEAPEEEELVGGEEIELDGFEGGQKEDRRPEGEPVAASGEIQEVEEGGQEQSTGKGGQTEANEVATEEGGDEEAEDEGEEDEPESSFASLTSGWNLGSLISTIATKSEEVLKEYQAELQEFGVGLQKETEELVETTTHTVKDLHLKESLEAGAQVAQSSLEEVGQSIEELGSTFWKGTSTILERVQEAVATVEAEVSAAAEEVTAGVTGAGTSRTGSSQAAAAAASKGAGSFTASMPRGKYSRFDALVSAMQRDSSTYCDEPEDADDFASWQEGFSLEKRKGDIEELLAGNAFMQELQSRIVPLIVEQEVFWSRYFYRLHKLQQAEEARSNLVKRATAEEEEDLSWDVDEDDDDDVDKATGAEADEDTEVDASEADVSVGAVEDGDGYAARVEKERVSELGEEDGKDRASPVDEKSDSSGVSSSGSEWQVVANDEVPGQQGGSEHASAAAAATGGGDGRGAAATSAAMSKVDEDPEGVAGEKQGATSAVNRSKGGAARGDIGAGVSSQSKSEEGEDWGEWE